MRTVGVERVEIKTAFISSSILDDNLDDFADLSRERAGYGVDAVVCEGSVHGGEVGGVVLVQGDEVGFLWEGFEPWVGILDPNCGTVDALVDGHGYGAGNFGGGGHLCHVMVCVVRGELVVEEAAGDIGDGDW